MVCSFDILESECGIVIAQILHECKALLCYLTHFNKAIVCSEYAFELVHGDILWQLLHEQNFVLFWLTCE